MRPSRNSVPLGTLAAIGVTFLLLAATGSGRHIKVDAAVALLIGGVVLVYLIWSSINTRAAKPHLLLPDEEKIDEIRRHPIIRNGAIVIAAVGVGLVLYSLALHAAGSITIRQQVPGLNNIFNTSQFCLNHPRKPRCRPSPYHFALDLWWWPLLLAIPLLILALFVWQNWKYTTLVITNKRFIVKREVAPYVPWLTPYFNQTPFQQIVDNDDSTGPIGTLFNWGTLNVTRKLMEASDKEEPVDRYYLLPDYINFGDKLRTAREEFERETDEKQLAMQQAQREQEERLLREQTRHFARIGDALERLSPPPAGTAMVPPDPEPSPEPSSTEETSELPTI